MHSLVHMVLRLWTKEVGDEAMSEDDAVKHLDQVFPTAKWENRLVVATLFAARAPSGAERAITKRYDDTLSWSQHCTLSASRWPDNGNSRDSSVSSGCSKGDAGGESP